MTDEEIAKRAEENLEKRSGTYGYNNFSICAKPYKDGFFDGYFIGAKENAPQWHDLRKAPNDLPAWGKWILCYMNESYHDRYIVGMTDEINDNEPFLVGYETDETNGFENVVAWCEIPKFKEEI